MGTESFRARRRAAPQAAGFFIGRGLLQNPWILAELKSGVPVEVSRSCLILALSNFGLLHELALTMPEKLLSLVAEGRVGKHCGVNETLWEASAHTLMKATNLPATVISREIDLPSLRLSPISFARVRNLWTSLRKALPPEYGHSRIIKAKDMNEFIGEIWKIGAEKVKVSGDREKI